ncbi:MAG: zinc-binding alcohol dehydrogenase [Gaiellaceae bacterium]
MPERREIRCLGIEEPGRAFIWTYLEELLADGQFQVETLYSGLSAGTELTFFKGTNPYLRAGWNEQLGVFDEAVPAREYPVRFLGYMEVGRVLESSTSAVSAGELVAMTYGHKTGHTADREPFVVLPDDLDPLLGIYVAQMGPICANGLLHAAAEAQHETQVELGDGVRGRCVLVTGAGVVGLLTALWARHLGAEQVAVADVAPERLAAVEALGLMPVDDTAGTAWRWVKDGWRHGSGDCGADVVFQCRGRVSALVTALRALRPQGTVIDVAFYQEGAPELRLGEEFHHNGLSLRCAQISRVPRGLAPLWDRSRLAGETVAFLKDCGELVLEHVVTDLVPFEEAPAFLADLAAHQRTSIQAVFEVAP